MAINAFPINTVLPAANLITNTPFGVISATDVQTALNQLASAIPSPGPGTDPLFLTHGLDITTLNPNLGSSSFRQAMGINASFDCSNIHPDFTNAQGLGIFVAGLHGQATYGTNTQVKESFFGINASAYYAGSGQKFMFAGTINAFGMSDTAMWGGQNVTYCGGPVNGDEGQGWSMASVLGQRGSIFTYTITAKPTQATLNTTITQAVTRSENAQTVTVASTAGAAAGDWLVIDQELPNAGQNLEAVQLISVGSGSITGVFRCNHLIGATTKPALVFTLDGTFGLGQDRVLVNLSQASFSAGTVTNITGGGFTGSGTLWSNTMVGGNALNIGAITLTADDYSLPPFDSVGNTPLRSWYQINTVVSNTSLGIFRTSVAGDGAYVGKGPIAGSGNPASTYTIRACARILRIVNSGSSFTGQVICENSSSTWQVGDVVEEVMCPYPDVTGFQYHLNNYANGGTLRYFMLVRNMGPRKFASCITVEDIVTRGPQTDGVAFDTVFSVQTSCKTGLFIGANCTEAAIRLQSVDAGSAIIWGTGGITASSALYLNSTNSALTINAASGLTPPNGQLIFAASGTGINPESNMMLMQWNGFLHLPARGSNTQKILMDRATDPVNFERSFMRWGAGNSFYMGVEKGGSGNLQDFAIMSGAVEQLRFIAADGIQISNPACFSANGSVATTMTSLGPAGASTTVRKWLTVKDNGGVTGYIPVY